MLGVGWTEMLVIGVVALIFIGPKDLPMVMNKIGRFVSQMKRLAGDFQAELNRSTGLDEVRNLRESVVEPLRKTSDEIRNEFNTLGSLGTPQPSGAIKPKDPAKESVVDEIRTAAGMPARPAPAKAQPQVQSAATPKAGPGSFPIPPAPALAKASEAAEGGAGAAPARPNRPARPKPAAAPASAAPEDKPDAKPAGGEG